jgi:hypothetical protein
VFFDAKSKTKVDQRETGNNVARTLKDTQPDHGLYGVASLRTRDHDSALQGPKAPGHLRAANARLDQSLAIPQYRVGVLGVLQDRYVPNLPRVSGKRGRGICSSWIANACDLSLTSKRPEMLIDSMLAMSFAVVEGERHDEDVSRAGLKHYTRALTALRVSLASGSLTLGQNRLDISLVTCLSCGMYEACSSIASFV